MIMMMDFGMKLYLKRKMNIQIPPFLILVNIINIDSILFSKIKSTILIYICKLIKGKIKNIYFFFFFLKNSELNFHYFYLI
jgi:hypothetical protein